MRRELSILACLLPLLAGAGGLPLDRLNGTYDGVVENDWSVIDTELRMLTCHAFTNYKITVANGGQQFRGDVTAPPLALCIDEAGKPVSGTTPSLVAGHPPPPIASTLAEASGPPISQSIALLIGPTVIGSGQTGPSGVGIEGLGCHSTCSATTTGCFAWVNFTIFPTGVGGCGALIQGCQLTCLSGGKRVLVGNGSWKIFAQKPQDSPFLPRGAPGKVRADLGGVWYNSNESGWGLSIAFGSTLEEIPVVVLYVYAGGQPAWFIMPGGRWESDWTFSGDLYSSSGTDYRAGSFDPSHVTATKVGSLRISLSPDGENGPSGVLDYSIKQPDGSNFQVTGKPIVKQKF